MADQHDDAESHDQSQQVDIHPYDAPAGGWGALQASLTHIIQNKGVVRNFRSLLRVNQPDGFDCPGCAWPDPGHASAFEFCENGVKAVTFESTAKRVEPHFFSQHSVSSLREQSDHWLENQGRLTHPMRYNAATDHYEPIEWDDAFELIGDKLNALTSPDEAIFYTSGRTSNEAAFLYQLFGRMFGTNNFPDCSNMCHESSGVALGEQIGIGKGTVTLDDFDKADAIFVIGQNPGTNHPRMLTALQNASERGARIVTLNPLKEQGLVQFAHPQRVGQMLAGTATPISSLYLQVLIGGDMAALKGIMKHVLEAPGDVLDHDFIKRHTIGFDDFAADIGAADWDVIETQSGLTREQLREAADVYLGAKSVIICWAMGLTQHTHAVATIQQAVNLLLLGGHIGRPGAGACPVRGHSNVQGDRTMGITEQPKPAFLDALKRVFNFEPPREHGHDVVGAINAMLAGTGKVFIGLGGNFLRATPDTPLVDKALQKCELTVQISTKLNHSHLACGKDALILPCLGRTERDVQAGGLQQVTVEDSMSQVHASSGKNPPASVHLRSEPSIVAGIAAATLKPSACIDWHAMSADYSRIRDAIAAVLPEAFHEYNDRIKAPGGFYLGNSAASHDWRTATGKASFVVADIPDMTLPAGQLRMMTIRSHDQFNTTVYDNNDRYRGIFGTRRVILMSPEDIATRGLLDGDFVDITSHSIDDGQKRHAAKWRVVEYDIPVGCAATYFPEANVLVSKNSFAKKSRTPVSKFVPITVVRTNTERH